jgi:hypothetical protein
MDCFSHSPHQTVAQRIATLSCTASFAKGRRSLPAKDLTVFESQARCVCGVKGQTPMWAMLSLFKAQTAIVVGPPQGLIVRHEQRRWVRFVRASWSCRAQLVASTLSSRRLCSNSSHIPMAGSVRPTLQRSAETATYDVATLCSDSVDNHPIKRTDTLPAMRVGSRNTARYLVLVDTQMLRSSPLRSRAADCLALTAYCVPLLPTWSSTGNRSHHGQPRPGFVLAVGNKESAADTAPQEGQLHHMRRRRTRCTYCR